jgi:hypothetical protein
MLEALLNFDYDTNTNLTIRKQLISTVFGFWIIKIFVDLRYKLINDANSAQECDFYQLGNF